MKMPSMDVFYNIRFTLLFILFFCSIFAFKLISFFNSSHLSFIISFIILFFNQAALSAFLRLLKKYCVLCLIVLYILIIFFISFNTVATGAYDFSMIVTWFNGLLSLLSIMALMCIFTYWNNNKSIFDVLVYLLILQTFFILLMLIIPEFRDFIQSYTRNDSQLERMATYGGVRGLGLSGSIAFGLSTAMGFLGLCLQYWLAFERKSMNFFSKYLLFFLCLIASLSAGRTAILGFVLGFLFYFVSYGVVRASLYSLKYFLTAILVTYLLYILIVTDEQTAEIVWKYINYAFQNVFNYLSTGELSTTSTVALQNMYFYPPNNNLLFGDGYYSGDDGGYYLDTDAGYMRFLLNFGVVGSLLIYGSFVLLLLQLISKTELKGKYSLFITILLLFFIYHYKGDVIFYSVSMMKILFMIGFYGFLKSQSEFQA
ncbi:hypothetical protein [Pseudoalteromonas nigrifaciens]|uniref:hypothetical protein n=1 Tax=Pseudoalteromonas nigrifaciens TaxID=28109 RepID=UPI003FB79DFF